MNIQNLLASEMKKVEIKYTMLDYAFDSLEDAGKAQELSDIISIRKLHRKLEEFSRQFCPIYQKFNLREVGNYYNVGIEGDRMKHTMGSGVDKNVLQVL